jgi:hypothetical protein
MIHLQFIVEMIQKFRIIAVQQLVVCKVMYSCYPMAILFPNISESERNKIGGEVKLLSNNGLVEKRRN